MIYKLLAFFANRREPVEEVGATIDAINLHIAEMRQRDKERRQRFQEKLDQWLDK